MAKDEKFLGLVEIGPLWIRIVLILLIVGGIIFLLRPFEIIKNGEIGVVTRWGNVTKTLNSGLSFKLPLIDQVTRYKTGIQTIERRFDAATSDGLPITVNVGFSYILDAKHITELHIKMPSDYQSYIAQYYIEDIVKTLIGQKDAETMMNNSELSYLEAQVINQLDNLLYNEYYIYSKRVSLSIQFPDAYVSAQNDARLQQMKLEQQRAEAEAIAANNRVLANSLSPLVLQQQAIEKWDGKLPQAVGNGANYPVVGLFQ